MIRINRNYDTRVRAFPNRGGYVLHKFTSVPGSECTFSVWFTHSGRAYDAERYYPSGRIAAPTPKQLAWIKRSVRII